MKIASLLSLVFVAGFCVAVSANEEVAPVVADVTTEVVAPVAPADVTTEGEESSVEGEKEPAAEQN